MLSPRRRPIFHCVEGPGQLQFHLFQFVLICDCVWSVCLNRPANEEKKKEKAQVDDVGGDWKITVAAGGELVSNITPSMAGNSNGLEMKVWKLDWD